MVKWPLCHFAKHHWILGHGHIFEFPQNLIMKAKNWCQYRHIWNIFRALPNHMTFSHPFITHYTGKHELLPCAGAGRWWLNGEHDSSCPKHTSLCVGSHRDSKGQRRYTHLAMGSSGGHWTLSWENERQKQERRMRVWSRARPTGCDLGFFAAFLTCDKDSVPNPASVKLLWALLLAWPPSWLPSLWVWIAQF